MAELKQDDDTQLGDRDCGGYALEKGSENDKFCQTFFLKIYI